jgi:hypothetical protein
MPPRVDLGREENDFTVPEQIALRDVAIRQRFASTVLWLFVATNAFVMAALGILYWQDVTQLTAGRIAPGDRIIDARVVITLLGATTVQLGTVIYTISRAIFPGAMASPQQD